MTHEKVWVDRYGLPIEAYTDPLRQPVWEEDFEEVLAKLGILEVRFGGPVVRWDADDHAAGLYGDPSDPSESSSRTGWVIQRHEKRCEFPPNPGRGIGDAITQLDTWLEAEAISAGKGTIYQVSEGSYARSTSRDPWEATLKGEMVRASDASHGQDVEMSSAPPLPELPANPHFDVLAARVADQGSSLMTAPQLQQQDVSSLPVLVFRRRSTAEPLTSHDRELIEHYRIDAKLREQEFRGEHAEEERKRRHIRTNSEIALEKQQQQMKE